MSDDEVAIAEALLRMSEDDDLDSATHALLSRLATNNSLDALTRSFATSLGIRSSDQALALALNHKEGAIVRGVATMRFLSLEKTDGASRVRDKIVDTKLPLAVRFVLLAVLIEQGPDREVHLELAHNDRLESPLRRFAVGALGKHEKDVGIGPLLLGLLQGSDAELQLSAVESVVRLRTNNYGGTLDFSSDIAGQIDERLIALAEKATTPEEIRVLSLRGLRRFDRLPAGGHRATALFGNVTSSIAVRGAAAESVVAAGHIEQSNAKLFVGVLRTEPRLAKHALSLLEALPPTAPELHGAVESALTWFETTISTRGPDRDELRSAAAGLLAKLARAGFLRAEIGSRVLSLQRVVADGNADPLWNDALGVLAPTADVAPPIRRFLLEIAKDHKLEAAARAEIIRQLSKTDHAYVRSQEHDTFLHPSQPAEVRVASIEALARLGEDADRYLNDLLTVLEDSQSSPRLRRATFDTLRASRTDDQRVIVAAVKSAVTQRANRTDPEAVPEQDGLVGEAQVAASAITLLESLGRRAKSCLPALEAALRDRKSGKPRTEIGSLAASIAVALADAKDVGELAVLRRLQHLARELKYESQEREIARAVVALENAHFALATKKAVAFFQSHLLVSLGIAYVLLGLAIGTLLVFLSPLTILTIDRAAGRFPQVSLPRALGGFTISLRPLLILTVFRHHRRVLEAWVLCMAPVVRETFFRKTAVRQREVYVPATVTIDGQAVTQLDRNTLRTSVSADRFVLTIEGEGGAGKSTLAFAIARAAIEQVREKRLRNTLMLPILLDANLEERGQGLVAAVAAELGSLTRTQSPLPLEFVRELLARQHILVVVDGFSERSNATQSELLRGAQEVPASAVVFTSRGDVEVGGSKTVIRPQRIQGNSVSSFLHGYLDLTRQRSVFNDDEEFFRICKDLSALTKNRDITPLLAKMYAEYAVARKQGLAAAQSVPETIPALISCYVNTVAEAVRSPFTTDTIQDFLRIIAWECVQDVWIPGVALRERVRASLGASGDEKLALATERLQLVEQYGLGLRFAVDPLAEYLAAMHLLVTQARKWSETLERLKTDLDNGRAPAFKAVLLDCYGCAEVRRAVDPGVAAKLFGGTVSAVHGPLSALGPS
jgi:hypothetical protein